MIDSDFTFFAPPASVMADVATRINALREELPHARPARLIEPFQKLTRVRGNFAFDLISSIAWAAEVVCGSAAAEGRALNGSEMRSLQHAINSMDRARRAASLAAAA